jgi:hypothetical protein
LGAGLGSVGLDRPSHNEKGRPMTALARIENQPRMSSLDEMKAFAEAAVRSKFYGFKTADEMLPLMIIAQSEGRSFASVVQEYDIISGKPSLKAEAMLARFQKSGGHIQWTELSDARCSAIFSHPQCAPVEIDWDMRRAQQAQIKNHMWAKYPRNMLKARVISDGVRTAFPACLGGLYTPEEVSEFVPARPQVSPVAQGKLVAHEEPGQVETPREPSPSIIEHDGEEVDQTTQPEWPILESEMEAYSTREDLKAWWTNPENKKLKERKPHFMRAFYRGPFAIRWNELGETVVYEDEPGAQG